MCGSAHAGCPPDEAGYRATVKDIDEAQQAMAIGTAGYTAMLCVLALERHGVTPAHGEILVTAAAGGVGSVAIAVLVQLGYTVVAVSGRRPEGASLAAWIFRPRSRPLFCAGCRSSVSTA